MAHPNLVKQRNPDATLWVGELDSAVTEDILWELFVQVAPVTDVHMPRDKLSGQHQFYGFVEFASPQDAEYAMRIMNMISLYGKTIRLNKSTRKDDHSAEIVGAKLFVGSLDPQVDEKLLYDVFSAFGFITSAPRIAKDDEGETRGFAFVTFDTFEAADNAIANLHGQYLCGRPISVSYAFKKESSERHGSEAERALAARTAALTKDAENRRSATPTPRAPQPAAPAFQAPPPFAHQPFAQPQPPFFQAQPPFQGTMPPHAGGFGVAPPGGGGWHSHAPPNFSHPHHAPYR